MIKRILTITLALAFTIGLMGCSKTETKPKELDKVTFVLDWLPNTNHTGIYSALEKGYFKDEGIELKIVQPSEGDVNSLIAAGKGDFGVSFQEQITAARTTKNSLPIKAIAAIIQHNTSGFASPKTKNIKAPKDFQGKTYGSWGTPIEKAFIDALMKKDNADSSKVKSVDIGSSDFITSVSNNVDFAWIYYGWDGISAEKQNMPINFMKLQDLDKNLDFYTPVIIANEDTLKNKSDLVKRFLKAATKGYEFAINSPEEAVKDLLKNAPETDKDMALASQKYLSKEYKSDASRWGEMKESVWETFGSWMYDNKLIETKLNAKEAFTNEYLPK